MGWRDRDMFENELDELLRALARSIDAHTDAACCGTRSDWKKANEKRQDFEDAKERFIEKWKAVIP